MNDRRSRNLFGWVLSARCDGFRAWRDESAATSVEYALFVLLLAVSAVVGFVSLSALTGFVFRTVSTSVASRSPEVSAVIEAPGYTNVAQQIEAAARQGSLWIEESFSVLDILICFIGGCVGLILAVTLVMTFARPGTRRRRVAPESVSAPASKLHESHRQALFAKRNLLRRILRRSLDDRAGVNLPLRYFMSDKLETVDAQTAVHLLGVRMREKGIRHLIVVDRDNTLLGVISLQDIHARVGRTAGDIMTTEVVTATPETPIGQAITLLLQKGISCIPIVENGKLCGILTTTDVLIGFQALLQAWELVFQPLPEDEGDENNSYYPPGGTPVESETTQTNPSFATIWTSDNSSQPPEASSRPV